MVPVFFQENIPPIRPVLVIADSHATHISIEIIELALANNVHLLYLQPLTTHFLQPLDVHVVQDLSFKGLSLIPHEQPRACQYCQESWPQSVAPLSIINDCKKCGKLILGMSEINSWLLQRQFNQAIHSLAQTVSTCSLIIPRAYRAAEGGERACNINSPYVDSEILYVTKNNTSARARECKSTNRKRMDTKEYGPLQAGARK